MMSRKTRLHAFAAAPVAALILSAAIALAPADAAAEPREPEVDLTHTSVTFVISHGGFSKVPYQFRTVEVSEFVFDPDDVSNSKVKASVLAASIDSNHYYRDNFTRSEVFLNAREFKNITFESTEIEKTGENTGTMTGNMTIRDVTKPVTFDVVYNKTGKHLSGDYSIDGFTATGTFKRSEFGIDAFLPWVGDEIEVTIMLEAHH